MGWGSAGTVIDCTGVDGIGVGGTTGIDIVDIDGPGVGGSRSMISPNGNSWERKIQTSLNLLSIHPRGENDQKV